MGCGAPGKYGSLNIRFCLMETIKGTMGSVYAFLWESPSVYAVVYCW